MKNKLKFLIAYAFFFTGIASAQVGVGTTTPDASAVLDVSSSTKGLLMPRMTTVQRTAIASPAAGLQVYDTDTKTNWYYNGTVWVNGSSSGSKFTNDATNTLVKLTNLSDGSTARPSGKSFVITDAGNVGIGTTSPEAALKVLDSVWNKDAAFFDKVVAENDEWPATLALRTATASTDATFHKGIFNVKGTVRSNGTGTFIKTSNIELGNFNNGATVDDAFGVTTWNSNDSGIVRNSKGFSVGRVQATGADSQPHKAYGIYINDLITASGGTTNEAYAIYSAATVPSYFTGVLESNDYIKSNVGAYAPQMALTQYGSQVVPGVPVYGMGFNATNQVAFSGYFGLDFHTQNATSFTTPVMRIDGAGNVGIGTIAAQAKLDVVGTIKVSDDGSSSAPVAGMIRFNSTTNTFEGYNGSTWVTF